MRAASIVGSRVAPVVVVVTLGVACGSERDGFSEPVAAQFQEDAGDAATPVTCGVECSADLRSLVDTCVGKVVETCPPNLACGAKGCVEPCAAAAEAKGSLGCEFLMQPPPTSPGTSRSCYAAYLVNGQPTPATFDIEYDGAKRDLSKAVYEFEPGNADPIPHAGPLQPGEAVVVFLADPPPAGSELDHIRCPSGVVALTAEWPNPSKTGLGKSFRVTSDVPLAAATIYPFGGAASYYPSATLLLPVVGWGKQHVVVSAWTAYPGAEGGELLHPGFHVVASEDDTEVVIRPSKDLIAGPGFAGAAAGVPQTFKLQRGQTLQVSQQEDPTGSTVESTKPTSIFGGHSCMQLPGTSCCCDAAQQQLPAIAQWGNEYAVVGHRARVGNEETSPVRIVAAFDGTKLTYEPTTFGAGPRQLAAGEVATFDASSPFVVRSQDADHPFYVAQYMTSAESIGLTMGDPEFVSVVPAGQYLSGYTFYADPTYTESSIVIVRRKTTTGFKDVHLECAGEAVQGFAPIGASGLFEYVRVDLTKLGKPQKISPTASECGKGLHRLKSDGTVAATLWGWASYASYAYTGGTGQRKLVNRELVVR